MKTYGLVVGPRVPNTYYKMTAGEKFFIKGGSLVTLDDGVATLCTASSTSAFGFALAPDSVKDNADHYLTVAGDKMQVNNSKDVVFSMPSTENYAVAQNGKRYKLSNANTTTIQKVANGAVDDTNGVVRIVNGVVGKKIVHVQLALAKTLEAGA